MSTAVERRVAAATTAFVLLSILQYALISINAAPAGAHHPEVSATSVCDDEVAFIDFSAEAWATDDSDRRHNNDVRVSLAGVEVASGAFNEGNGYSFDGRIDATGYEGQTVTVRVTAVTRWGIDEDKGSAGEYRETTVEVVEGCAQPQPQPEPEPEPEPELPPYEPSRCPIPDQEALARSLNADGKIHAAGTVGDAEAGPFAIELPAGTYDVYLTSRDSNHAQAYDPSQVEESYYVEGFFGGASVWQSPAISDLPDDVVSLTQLVASDAKIPELDAVVAVHAGYPNDIANSVESVCVVFVPKSEPTQPTTSTVVEIPKSALGDLVWFDDNENGRQDGGDVEFPVQGATVSLLTPDGTVLEDQVTGPDGRYLFDELDAGNYRVRVCLSGADYTAENALGVADDVDSDVFALGEGCGMTGLINLPAGVTDLTWDAGVIVEVLGIQVEPTTTTAPPPVEPVTVETLPFTGAETEQTVLVALGAMLAGAAMLFAVSRRDDEIAADVVDSGTSWSNQRP
jgi:LPXTG-motif cell wall-anchored protein